MGALTCFNCNGSLADVVLPFSRRADCPHCRAELHCCLMCTQFHARIEEQCREERAEPPSRKDVANFCEWFTPAAGRSAAMTPAQRAQTRLDALFEVAPEAPEAPERDGSAGTGEERTVAAQGSGADVAQEADAASDESLSPEQQARRRLDNLFR